MGYKVQYETGETIEFESEPSQQDIDEAYTSISTPTKRSTTLGEDIGISLGSAGSTVLKGGGLLAGGLAGSVGANDLQESIYKGSEELAKTTQDYWTPKDTEQGIGGKVAGTLLTLPSQMLAMPFSSADTGRTMVEAGETLDKAITGTLLETLGNVAGFGLGTTGKTVATRMALSGLGNAAQDVATKQAIKSIADTEEVKQKYTPTVEDTAVAGIIGSIGGILPDTPTKKQTPPVELRTTRKTFDPVTDYTLAKETIPLIDKHIDTIKSRVNQINESGDFSEANTTWLEGAEEVLLELELEKNKLENLNPEKDQARIDKSLELKAKIEELKERKKLRGSNAPLEGESIEMADTRALSKPEPTPREIIQQVADEQPIPKTTPTEIALTKIGEMLNKSPEEIGAKITETEGRLDSLSESARENAIHELEVLKDLKNQKEAGFDVTLDDLDVSWFENKKEIPLTTEVKESPFRTEEQSWKAKEQDINEVNSSISALEKTAKETEPLISERQELIAKKDKTLADYLRIAELNDLYTEIAVRNDPVNELRDAIIALKEERADIQWMVDDDPAYVKARTEVIDKQLLKYEQFEQRATDLYNKQDFNVEEVHAETPAIEAPKPVFNTIADIYAHGGEQTLQNLVDNRDTFFNRVPEKQVFFDKTFQDSVFGKVAQKVLTHFIDVLGLDKDGIYISFDTSLEKKVGNVYHTGDVSHIRLNPSNIAKVSKPIQGVNFGFLKGKALENARVAYTAVRVGAHEIGHVLLNKAIQKQIESYEDFDKIIKDFEEDLKVNRPTNIAMSDFWRGDKSAAGYVKQQEYFHEYFAERVAKQLLSKHALGAFSRGRGKTFQTLMDASINYLKERGINVDRKAFIDDTISNIISSNEASIKAAGQTIWESIDLIKNDQIFNEGKVPGEFWNKSLEEVLGDKRVQNIIPDKNPFLGLDTNDLPTMSRKALKLASRAARATHQEFFNRNNIADFDPNDPKVGSAYKAMRDIDIEMEGYETDLLYDQQSSANMSILNTFRKVHDAASMYMTLRKMTDLDSYEVMTVLQKGFDEGIPYEDNLKKNGGHLTEQQVKYYNTLAKTYDKAYTMSRDFESNLGKKDIISKRDGWFPSTRVGNFTVTINFGGLIARRQNFRTKLEAEKFRQKLLDSPITQFQISDVIDLQKGDKVISSMEVANSLAESYARLFPQAEDVLRDKSEAILEAFVTRGGKLGKHHEYRYNIAGYKGNELFKTKEEMGRSFKEANEQFISEKAMQMRAMKYRHVFGQVLENPDFQKNNPNSYDAIKQMYDNSLNRNVDFVNELGGELSYRVDKIANDILDVFGKERTSDKPLMEVTTQGIRDTFTAFFMTAKPLFVLAQILSVPPMTIAKMAYQQPFKAPATFMKGMFKLFSGNKELWDVIKEVSRTTKTFDAQFMESFALQKSSKPIVEALKDWVLLQAPGRGAESLSRIMTFAAFYEMTGDVNTSIIKTGDTLALYDKANSPAFFSHMGFVGDAMKPLQSYGQNMLGNIIGMVRYVDKKDAKTLMPLVHFAALSIAISGAQGLPFIQEYEALRLLLKEKFGVYELPSYFDLVYSKEGLLKDGVSQEMANAAMLGGGSLTGIDIASSARPNKSLPANLLSLAAGETPMLDMMPLHKWAMSVPGAVRDIAKGIGDNAKAAEVKKAFETVAPSGPVGYGIKEIAGLNETTVFGENTGKKIIGKSGEASSSRTTADKVAGYLGGKSTDSRMEELTNYQVVSKEKERQERIDNAAIKLTETGNRKHLQTLMDLDLTEKEINNLVERQIFNRVAPQDVRMLMNKAGKVTKRGERAAQGLFNFRRD